MEIRPTYIVLGPTQGIVGPIQDLGPIKEVLGSCKVVLGRTRAPKVVVADNVQSDFARIHQHYFSIVR